MGTLSLFAWILTPFQTLLPHKTTVSILHLTNICFVGNIQTWNKIWNSRLFFKSVYLEKKHKNFSQKTYAVLGANVCVEKLY